MNPAPLISIVTPFFQVGNYLEEAIESVLAQSFTDWELILVDDGSTDQGPRVARAHAARDPARIRVLEHPGHENRGISASRNLGAAHARGRWIASLDGDDVWLPGKLADQARIVAANPDIGLVVGASVYWQSWAGGGAPADRVVAVGAPPDRIHEPPRLLDLLYPLGTGAAPSMNTLLVRSDMLKRVGGWEEAFPTAYEDQALLAKLYLATPVYVSSASWDLYRQRPGSCMDVELRGAAYHVHRRRFLEWFDGYLAALGGHEAIRSRVRAAHWRYRHPVLHGAMRGGRRIARSLAAGRFGPS